MKPLEFTWKEYADFRIKMTNAGKMGKGRGCFQTETRKFMLDRGVFGKLGGRIVKIKKG